MILPDAVLCSSKLSASLSAERGRKDHGPESYSVRLCRNTECRRILLNRDVNAAINILHLFLDGSKADRSHQNSVELGSDLCLIKHRFCPSIPGDSIHRTGMVCQPEVSACMLWGSHMNNIGIKIHQTNGFNEMSSHACSFRPVNDRNTRSHLRCRPAPVDVRNGRVSQAYTQGTSLVQAQRPPSGCCCLRELSCSKQIM